MTFHSMMPTGRLIAPGGPVSAAIAAMRQANDLPPLLAKQFDDEALEIAALRQTIKRQLQADLNRVDRCLVVLDALDGDDDLEPTCGLFTPGHVDEGEDGGDLEPSLCGITASAPGYSDTADLEADAGDEPEIEDEHGGDVQDEPHDAEEDKGAEEDEGPGGFYHCDRSQAVVARAALQQLDEIASRHGRVTESQSRPITVRGPYGDLFVARRL